MEAAFILIGTFMILLFLHVPIAFGIGISTLVTILLTIDFDPATQTIAQRMAGGINSFALLAIPFFILSGLIMGRGGIARRLIDASKAILGTLPGGLAFVNVMSCMLFGSISGSAVAVTSAIGGTMVPEMEKAGYKRNFSAALTGAASAAGMPMPPSNILIIYAVASGGISIAALFMAGYLPSILMGLSLMVLCAIFAKRWHLPSGERIPLKDAAIKILEAVPSLLLIVLVIGGILSGIVTPTEAAVLAVLYALILAVGIYKEVSLRQLPEIFLKSVETTAIVMLLIGASTAMSWILSYENVPQALSQALLFLSDNPIVILLIINLILLIVGTFLDMTPAVLIFTPILLPVVIELGMSPLHFGIMMIVNLSIGLCTPPVGTILFVSCAVAKISITDILRPFVPFYIALFLVLLLVTYVPWISEALPRALGLY